MIFKILSTFFAVLILSFAPSFARTVVVTDLPPIQALTKAIAGKGNNIKVRVIVKRQADAHHFQLRPSDIRTIMRADIVVWTGVNNAPWMDKVLKADTTPALSLVLGEAHSEDGHDEQDEHGHDEHGHDEHGHDEHGHDEHDEHDEHGHDEHDAHDAHGHDEHGHGAHLWLDPDIALVWAEEIAEIFSKFDPNRAATYQRNKRKLQAEIRAVKREVKALLAGKSTIRALAYHDAFGPFLERFDLKIIGSLTDVEDAPPSARHLHKLRKKIRRDGLECVLMLPGADPALVETVTSQKLRQFEVNPLGELGATYPALLRTLANALAKCEG